MSTTPEMVPIIKQIEQARIDQKLNISQLQRLSGIDCDRTNLSRKLDGITAMSSAECEVLATALGITIKWPCKAPAKKRKAA